MINHCLSSEVQCPHPDLAYLLLCWTLHSQTEISLTTGVVLNLARTSLGSEFLILIVRVHEEQV